MHQKLFLARAPQWTPLGDLTMVPRHHSQMGVGTPPSPPLSSTPSASRSWRITFKLLPSPLLTAIKPRQRSMLMCHSAVLSFGEKSRISLSLYA